GMFKAKFHIGANQGQNVDLEINSMSAAALEVAGDITYVVDSAEISAIYTEVNNDSVGEGQEAKATIKSGTYTVGGTEDAYTLLDSNGVVVATSTDGITFTGTEGNDGTADKIEFGSALKIGTEVVIDISETTATATISHDGITVANNGLDTGVYTVTAEGIVNSKDEIVATYDSGKDGYVNTEGDVVLAGDELAANTELKVGGINVSSQDKADIAITTINDAIESVSAERSKLGAMQNRLEHTIKNLDTSAENLQAAESRIRDVDMAKEMMEFTKQNILQQAAQAMLAHANQAPQGVLQLLR
ncbi:MAG: flagellin, partial [Firmicutes bacterium]|nr:flagellin [Bacillota bacterium]